MTTTQEKLAIVFSREEISELILLVATEKGAFLYYSDADRRHWDVNGPHFLGSKIHHIVLDPRDNKTLLISVESIKTGCTIYNSSDFGKNWSEASKIPSFSKNNKTKIDQIVCLAPGHQNEPNVWYAGTYPEGLFKSEDNGNSWNPVNGFNDNLNYDKIKSKINNDYSITCSLHSILVNPNNKSHIYVAISNKGIFESIDSGQNWTSINNGININNTKTTQLKHGNNPHSIISHPFNPDRIYQQNHCGIYRVDRPDNKWKRIGDNMPAEIGDIGFPIAIHPADPNTIWIFPIDKSELSSKVSPGGQPAIYCSQDGGETWFRQDIGLPMRNAWLTVLKKGLTTDNVNQAGVYFGTTSGSLWMSDNAGNSWRQIAIHLPKILAVETGILLKK